MVDLDECDKPEPKHDDDHDGEQLSVDGHDLGEDQDQVYTVKQADSTNQQVQDVETPSFTGHVEVQLVSNNLLWNTRQMPYHQISIFPDF